VPQRSRAQQAAFGGAEEGSVYWNMSTEERRAFAEWLKEQDADLRAMLAWAKQNGYAVGTRS